MTTFHWAPGKTVRKQPVSEPVPVLRTQSTDELSREMSARELPSLFRAVVLGRTTVPIDRDADVGDWLLAPILTSRPRPEWWKRVESTPMLLVAGMDCDFETVDMLEGTANVRFWDHEIGYDDLPPPETPMSWVCDKVQTYVECELLADSVNDQSATRKLAALLDELLACAGETERGPLRHWWKSTSWGKAS